MNDRLAIILFSGTADKLMAAANLAGGAAAAGKEVTVFLTFAGLLAFRKDDWKTNQALSGDLGSYSANVRELLQGGAMPSWLQVFIDARELGQLRITACLMTLEMFKLTLDDLEPVVHEHSNVNDFLASAQDATTLFI